MPNPPNNNDLQREKVRFLNDSLSLKRVIRQGSFANSSRDNVVPPVTPPPTSSVTPTISLTPTISPSPTITSTPTVTPTTTITPTPSITSTLYPTRTPTPTVTPTPTTTPIYDIPLNTLQRNQNFIINGYPDETYVLDNSFVNLKYIINGVYNTVNVNEYNSINDQVISGLEKYPYNGSRTYFLATTSQNGDLNYTLYTDENLNLPLAICSSPVGYGGFNQMPVSGYTSTTLLIPQSSVNLITVFNDLNTFTTNNTAVSTISIIGLTGIPFDNVSSQNIRTCVNGMLLEHRPDYSDWYFSVSDNNQLTVCHLFFDNYALFGYSCYSWVIYMGGFLPDATEWVYVLSSVSGYNNPNKFPDSNTSWRAHAVVYEENLNLSAFAVQDNIKILDFSTLNGFYNSTPTPTITPTITPTPTISVTPTITPTLTRTPAITPTISLTPSNTPTISITPSVSRSFDPNTIYTGASTVYVRGITAVDAAYELSGSYSFVAGATYFNNNTISDEYKFYLAFSNNSLNNDSAWVFFSTNDSGDFQRAYYPWSDSSVIPNTTGWLIGEYGYGTQTDYNYMVITKN